MNTKRASILLEVIFSIMIISLVVVNAMFIYKEFLEINKNEFDIEINKIELLNTKYFLQKNLHSKEDINKIEFSNAKLYFNSSLLLKNVTDYKLKTISNGNSVNICLNNKICKEFLFIL